VRLEGLYQLKKIHIIGTRSRDLPACSIVPQATTPPRAPKGDPIYSNVLSLMRCKIYGFSKRLYIILQVNWTIHPQLTGLSELYYDRPSVGQSVLVSGAHDHIFITVRQLRVSWSRTPSLTRGRACLLLCTIYLHFTCYLALFIH
jgi:hypothetical protein